jgi:hypothetical protein
MISGALEKREPRCVFGASLIHASDFLSVAISSGFFSPSADGLSRHASRLSLCA